jgi:hypothetical protein
MKNNNILLLLIATLGAGILCAIFASIAFTYYNGGFDELFSDDTTKTLEAAAEKNQPSDMDAAALLEAVQSAGEEMDADSLYEVQLIQKFQTCNASLTIFQTAMATVQMDPSFLDDSAYMAEIQSFLDDVDTNCGSLSDDEYPEAYAAMNKEMKKAEKSVNEFIGHYEDYFTYKKSRYLKKGNDSFDETIEHMQSAAEMLQEIMTEKAP